jgi:hypothetical protein
MQVRTQVIAFRDALREWHSRCVRRYGAAASILVEVRERESYSLAIALDASLYRDDYPIAEVT